MRQPSKAERSRSWQVAVETGFGFFLSLSIFLLMDQTGIGVLCVSAALLHELGHLIVMALFRVKLVRVRLQTQRTAGLNKKTVPRSMPWQPPETANRLPTPS